MQESVLWQGERLSSPDLNNVFRTLSRGKYENATVWSSVEER
jgi:hypothetical protein